MDYEEFKGKIQEELKDFFGKDAEVKIVRVRKNNGTIYDGIHVIRKDATHNVIPVIGLDSLYEAYERGGMDITDCFEAVYRELKRNEASQEMVQFAESLIDWDVVKESIYPILLSTEENKELLEKMVSTPMLDLSVVYIIRKEIPGRGSCSVKISRQMLENYGISVEKLHRQAMKNLQKDGYEFQNMNVFIKSMIQVDAIENLPPSEMYILTNSAKAYGAAGILNKKLMREFAGSRNFFILPSSVHETIFVPASEGAKKDIFDDMVKEVNETQVSEEERLSNHSYYYDSKMNEIRMCV